MKRINCVCGHLLEAADDDELEREELVDLLADLEFEFGPPDETMMAEAAALFDVLATTPRARTAPTSACLTS